MVNRPNHAVVNQRKWEEAKQLAARLPINDPLRDVIETGADIGRTIVSGQNLAQAAMRAAGERHISDLVAEYMAAAELLDAL
jgi:ATP-dependent protease HslVU (ClpYQ) peptidase subunit